MAMGQEDEQQLEQQQQQQEQQQQEQQQPVDDAKAECTECTDCLLPLENGATSQQADKKPKETQCGNGTANGNSKKFVKCNSSESSKKTQQNLFELVYEIIGEREQRTKEMGTLILLGIIIFLFVLSSAGFFVMWFTEYYNDKLLENIILAKDSETAQDWINPNPKYDLLLKVHVFNYTNIHDYLQYKADKIIVEDIGPLVYKEHTTKVDVVFNDNYTVTFRDHRSYEFLRDKSTHDENVHIVVPNVPLLAASLEVDKIKNLFKKTLTMGAIRNADNSVFKRLVARDFLWGYEDKILSLKNIFSAGGSSKFGLLKSRNGTSVDSLQINTGEDQIKKFSTITQFNGKPQLDFWTDDECNRIDGSPPSMFPPYMVQERERLNVFLQVLCRKIPLEFEQEVTIHNNIDALRYRTPLNVFANPDENPDNECYCQNTLSCLPSGVINATRCYDDAPIYPSFPHFFGGDPIIYKDFEGIHPQQELHQTFADIHPRFGFPIGGASRIQINLAVSKGELIRSKIRRLEDGTILPLIWIEITSGEYTEEIIDKLYASTSRPNIIQHSLKFGTLFLCLLFFSLIVAVFYCLAKKREEFLQRHEKILNAELRALQQLNLSTTSLADLAQTQSKTQAQEQT